MKTLFKISFILGMIPALFSCSGSTGKPDDNPDTVEISLPADPKPGSTAFGKRVLVTDFTGTGCIYCPQMTTLLRNVLGNSVYAKRVVLAVAHTYPDDAGNYPDPAYFSDYPINADFQVSSYPDLLMELNPLKRFKDYSSTTTNLQQAIDAAYNANPAQAGIAANSELDGNTLKVRVAVKSGTASPTVFRVGLWVLEDGIQAAQKGAKDESFNIHDNCLRLVKSSSASGSYVGYKLDKPLASGEVGDYTFSVKLGDSWNKDKCKYLVFVSAPDANGNYYVNNAGVAALGASVPYYYSN